MYSISEIKTHNYAIQIIHVSMMILSYIAYVDGFCVCVWRGGGVLFSVVTISKMLFLLD